MALRNIVTEGDEILRKECKEVKEVNDRIRETMADMLETMRSQLGVGIAAPQVGIMRRMFIAEPAEDEVYYMINPVILEYGEETSVDCEGCLSVPGLVGMVERPTHIKIEALDLEGKKQVYEFDDFHARVMQHEYDHLNGILYTDKAFDIHDPAEDIEKEAEYHSVK